MVLALRQQIKLTQQLLMTPQLQQAIKLLQLSRLELADTLRQEIEQNPLLEEIPSLEGDVSMSGDGPREDTETVSSEKTREISIETRAPMEDTNWEEDYANHYEASFSFSRETQDPNRVSRLDFLAKKPNLQSHLQWQLSHAELGEEQEKIGHFIIGNLNRHGFLEASIEDVIQEIGCSAEEAEHVLAIIQEMDPAGVAARDVKESLLLQLKRLQLADPLPEMIIRDHISLLEIKNYAAIARATDRSVKNVLSAVEIITRLDPFPGRPFSDEETHYIVPDVFIHKIDNEYVIVLNDEGLPQLQVSSAYKDILDNDNGVTAETKGYIKDKLKDAVWLIKSIQQRQRTIYKVMESLLKFQNQFFEKGVTHLKPLVLKDVAEDIGMHESTVSRVTTNKYVHTPLGIFELKYFFTTGLSQVGGDAVASESIRDKIRTLIKNEDPAKPLTDNSIAQTFGKENIKVARRTIAKYREQMGILPVKHRRKPRV